jgi:hexosaminidase
MITTAIWLALAAAAVPPQTPAPGPGHSLMPVPATMVRQPGLLRLDSTFGVTSGEPGDGRLQRAIARAIGRLERRTGTALGKRIADSGRARLTVEVGGPGEAVQSPEENESYRLEVTPSGARLQAATTVGALRGLETLLQLVERDSLGWYLPAVRIDDTPRFPWRGLLIDVGRHFEPVEAIKRQLEAMAAVKLNVLHWHLSEDQGFRVESIRHPLLHQRGSDGHYYTQAEIRDVVAFARDRGIRVVPEFDMPGHASAWFVGYPELASGTGPYAIERRFGVFAPTFDPTRETTYQFLDAFIAEMAGLFPDRYWHIGGDEVEGSEWRASASIRAFMQAQGLADNAALQAHFNRRMSEILTRHGRRMVGWDEILHPALPATTVIQSWRGQQALREGAAKGYSGILSAGYYLDHMQTAEFHYLVDPLPAGHTLTPEEARRVMGGEACMWHEHVTEESIDSRIWPRMAAIAERFWSPREVRDVADMYRRLGVMGGRLEALGLGHESHTPRMARRLADGQDASALIRLLSLTQPVQFGERSSLQRPTQLTPLTFAVDAARPDPPAHWRTRALAAAATGSLPDAPAARRELAARFAEWAALLPALDSLARRTPRVREALPAARALARVAAIGSETLTRRAGGSLDPAWTRARLAELATLSAPQGLLRISVIPGVVRLVRGGEGPP